MRARVHTYIHGQCVCACMCLYILLSKLACEQLHNKNYIIVKCCDDIELVSKTLKHCRQEQSGGAGLRYLASGSQRSYQRLTPSGPAARRRCRLMAVVARQRLAKRTLASHTLTCRPLRGRRPSGIVKQNWGAGLG